MGCSLSVCHEWYLNFRNFYKISRFRILFYLLWLEMKLKMKLFMQSERLNRFKNLKDTLMEKLVCFQDFQNPTKVQKTCESKFSMTFLRFLKIQRRFKDKSFSKNSRSLVDFPWFPCEFQDSAKSLESIINSSWNSSTFLLTLVYPNLE